MHAWPSSFWWALGWWRHGQTLGSAAYVTRRTASQLCQSANKIQAHPCGCPLPLPAIKRGAICLLGICIMGMTRHCDLGGF